MLSRPTAIFSGVQRDGDDDRGQTDGWMCYCGRPAFRYSPASQVPDPTAPNRILLVFLNREREVYTHRWEECEPGGTSPKDLDDRFKERKP